jgi:hypothetical protein
MAGGILEVLLDLPVSAARAANRPVGAPVAGLDGRHRLSLQCE